jgi:hypothetical protein
MTAQYIKAAGPGERHFVNQDFVDAVGELYPVTWEKIPLGWHVYTGWQGKDEVMFTQHGPVGEMEGQVYEVNFPPDRPEAFTMDILPHIIHTTLSSTAPKYASPESNMARQRITWDNNRLGSKWGETLSETATRRKQAARAPSGLYGFTKSIQASCEASIRKLNRQAGSLVKKSARKDPRVLEFLATHSKRGKSLPAKILMASYKDSLPKLASDKTARLQRRQEQILEKYLKAAGARAAMSFDDLPMQVQSALRRVKDQETLWSDVDRWLMDNNNPHLRQRWAAEKTAKHYGMYGYPAKTASAGLAMCNALREAAGIIGSDLHRRKAAKYANITGFLTQHGKTAKCGASKLLLSVYPDETIQFGKRASAETHPQTVDEWLAWDMTSEEPLPKEAAGPDARLAKSLKKGDTVRVQGSGRAPKFLRDGVEGRVVWLERHGDNTLIGINHDDTPGTYKAFVYVSYEPDVGWQLGEPYGPGNVKVTRI